MHWCDWRSFIFRHGYDYPPHGHWDYRDNYSYYTHDYYRGQQGRQGTLTQDNSARHKATISHIPNVVTRQFVTLLIKMLHSGPPKTPGVQTVTTKEHLSRNIQGAPTQRSTGETQDYTSMKGSSFALKDDFTNFHFASYSCSLEEFTCLWMYQTSLYFLYGKIFLCLLLKISSRWCHNLKMMSSGAVFQFRCHLLMLWSL